MLTAFGTSLALLSWMWLSAGRRINKISAHEQPTRAHSTPAPQHYVPEADLSAGVLLHHDKRFTIMRLQYNGEVTSA